MRIKPQALIGVELSANSVRIIKTDKKSRVLRAGRVELYAGSDGGQTEQERLLAALKVAKKKARVGGGKCVLCLSGPDIILRHFVMPNMDEQALRLNIDHEIQDFIAGDRYYVTHKVHSYITGADGGVQLKVLVAAALQSKVDEHIKVLRSAGFKPVCVDVSENAREKLLNYITGGKNLAYLEPPKLLPRKAKRGKKTKPAKTVYVNQAETPPDVNAAIITFGTAFTSVTIILGRRLYVSRYFNTGSREIIEKIAETEGVDKSNAVLILNEGDFFREDSDSPIAAQVKNMLDTLGAEITSVIEYSYYRERTHRVDTIYVSGSISHLKGVTPYLEELFGVPVIQIDNVISELFKKNLHVKDISPFLNVLGATLREAHS